MAGDVPEAATPLASLANPTAELLIANGQKVAVFESSTGGLLAAALQSVPGVCQTIVLAVVVTSTHGLLAPFVGIQVHNIQCCYVFQTQHRPCSSRPQA